MVRQKPEAQCDTGVPALRTSRQWGTPPTRELGLGSTTLSPLAFLLRGVEPEFPKENCVGGVQSTHRFRFRFYRYSSGFAGLKCDKQT